MAKKSQSHDVVIRMYCHGLGDCFLLTFPGDPKPVRVLIDCGILQNSEGETERLRAVADNLAEDCDRRIDLLIVTHEHWDHIAGFSRAQETFEGIAFDRVWLSWAENPTDPDAEAVKATINKQKVAFEKALGLAEMFPGAAMDSAVNSGRQIQDFLGLQAASKDKALKGFQVMDWLRERIRPGDYCNPGECRTLPGVNGVNVYVMGPPKDVAAIRKMNPTGDQGYRHAAENFGFAEALESLGDSQSPFERRYRIREEEAKFDPFFRENYGFPDDEFDDGGPEWRRIQDDWLLEGFTRLGLQLDTGINNTSLALAFELPDGRTLIFPGDAQIGNWLSWKELEYREGTRKLTTTTQSLLNRAVFYKVGHHGSHNATARVEGLEKMTGGALVAMIPVDKATAKTRKPPKTGWAMPFDKLLEALLEKTGECVLVADEGVRAVKESSKNSSNPRLKAFAKQLSDSGDTLVPGTERPLYVEYRLPL